MHPILKRIEELAVVPALVLDIPSQAGPLAQALLEGGLPCIEVTLRTPSALESLEKMARFSEDLLVGAGTVLNISQADAAIAAGAKFIVSPGMDAALIQHCFEKDIPIIPAANTPSEVMLAVNLGLKCVKFFPSQAYGGLPIIKALNGPFPNMRFLPTGGITRESMSDYLAYPPVLAVGGSWMIRREWMETSRFDIMMDACALTVDTVKRLRRSMNPV